MKTATGKKIDVSVDESAFLETSGINACSGGVVLSALNGAITCDNTLDTRLALAYEGMLPEVRITLFGRSTTRKHLS